MVEIHPTCSINEFCSIFMAFYLLFTHIISLDTSVVIKQRSAIHIWDKVLQVSWKLNYYPNFLLVSYKLTLLLCVVCRSQSCWVPCTCSLFIQLHFTVSRAHAFIGHKCLVNQTINFKMVLCDQLWFVKPSTVQITLLFKTFPRFLAS